MSRPTSRQIGDVAEERALAYLLEQGLELESRNFRSRQGEIDLVMRDGETTVFVEVRRRRHRGYGGAAASVGRLKRKRITATALGYLKLRYRRCDLPMRFDVIAIDGADDKLTWLQSAF